MAINIKGRGIAVAINIKGTVYRIMERQQVSDNFAKREIVVEVLDGKYPQLIPLEATNDQIQLLDGINVGDEVSIDLNIRGREWKKSPSESKFFVSLNVWRLERVGAPKPGGYGPEDKLPF